MSNTNTLENKVQLAILKWLKAKDYYCWRNSNLTRKIQGKYISNPYSKAGQGDIVVVLPGGKHLEIECKRTVGGRQSVDQVMHERRIKALGGYYLVAKSLDEVKAFLSTVA